MKSIKRNFFIVLIICIGFAGILYYYENIRIDNELKKQELAIRHEIDINYMDKTLVATVKDDCKIGKYTAFTKEYIDQVIEIKEIPASWVIDNPVMDKAFLVGMVAKEDFSSREQITFDALSDEEIWFGDYSRQKEYFFATNVADKAIKGTIIDVVVSYENGDYDVVIPKTKVLDIIKHIDENGNLLPGKEYKYEIVLSIDNEIDYRDMELASLLGLFKARKYFDELQPASEKTFDYEKMLEVKMLQDDIVSEKNKEVLENQRTDADVSNEE